MAKEEFETLRADVEIQKIEVVENLQEEDHPAEGKPKKKEKKPEE